MAFLEKFTDDEKELIVSLPYRAAMWVSIADDTADEVSDLHEKVALRDIINRKASGCCESAFVHEVMVALKERKSDWDKMEVKGEDIVNDCQKAMDIISDKMTERDQKAYKNNIMQIATSVAVAFREFDEKSGFFKKASTYCRIAIDKLIGKAKGETYSSEMLLSISLEEDVVLAKLAGALGYSDDMVLPE